MAISVYRSNDGKVFGSRRMRDERNAAYDLERKNAAETVTRDASTAIVSASVNSDAIALAKKRSENAGLSEGSAAAPKAAVATPESKNATAINRKKKREGTLLTSGIGDNNMAATAGGGSKTLLGV